MNSKKVAVLSLSFSFYFFTLPIKVIQLPLFCIFMAALVPIGGWRFVSKLLMIFTALAVFLEFPFLLVYSLIFASATMLAFLFQVAIYIFFWYLLFVSIAYRSMENYLLPLKSYSFIND